jgi:hypothetical protein
VASSPSAVALPERFSSADVPVQRRWRLSPAVLGGVRQALVQQMSKTEQRREGGNVGGELGLARHPHGDFGAASLRRAAARGTPRRSLWWSGEGEGVVWCGETRAGAEGLFIAEARSVGGGHGQWEVERAALRPMERQELT